jgi:peptidase E
MIFVNGGKTEDLIEKLLKFKQLEKIKQLIQFQDVLYIGDSAGSVLFGNYSKSDLFSYSEKNPNIINIYGEDAYDGLKIINKMIVPHYSEYRFQRSEVDKTICRALYSDVKRQMIIDKVEVLKRNNVEFDTIANNEAIFVINDKIEKLKYDWSNLPIIESKLTNHEKELLKITKKKK